MTPPSHTHTAYRPNSSLTEDDRFVLAVPMVSRNTPNCSIFQPHAVLSQCGTLHRTAIPRQAGWEQLVTETAQIVRLEPGTSEIIC